MDAAFSYMGTLPQGSEVSAGALAHRAHGHRRASPAAAPLLRRDAPRGAHASGGMGNCFANALLATAVSCSPMVCARSRLLWRRRQGKGESTWRRATTLTVIPETYVKVWVGKVRWVSDVGATVALQQVYGGRGPLKRIPECQVLPADLALVLDAKAADGFQRAMFGIVPTAVGGDDAVCEVRVHYSKDPTDATGELVMRKECPVLDAQSEAPMLLSDVMDAHERRLTCDAGEALATAQRLALPALVSTSYLLNGAKACLNRLVLEESVCLDAPTDDLGCDVELYDLRERLLEWGRGRDAGYQNAALVASLLRDLKPFALYWALYQITPANGRQPFGSFLQRYMHMLQQGGEDADDVTSHMQWDQETGHTFT